MAIYTTVPYSNEIHLLSNNAACCYFVLTKRCEPVTTAPPECCSQCALPINRPSSRIRCQCSEVCDNSFKWSHAGFWWNYFGRANRIQARMVNTYSTRSNAAGKCQSSRMPGYMTGVGTFKGKVAKSKLAGSRWFGHSNLQI
jgi:hypothetical protein